MKIARLHSEGKWGWRNRFSLSSKLDAEIWLWLWSFLLFFILISSYTILDIGTTRKCSSYKIPLKVAILQSTLSLVIKFQVTFFIHRQHTLDDENMNLLLAWLQLRSLRPKKLQGVGICPLINHTPINFHQNWSGLIGARQKLVMISENRVFQKWK